jgi:mannose/fructose/N-acetylgalactosamine-specific phosphotransferase system component IIC
VTNEEYLYVSYFVAAGIGVLLAIATATLWLRRSHRQATGGVVPATGLGRLLRRVFPTWLILAVLLGFASVTYFDCQHKDYASIVGDRQHLVLKTHEQAAAMSRALAIALTAYGFVLMLYLWSHARSASRPKSGPVPGRQP